MIAAGIKTRCRHIIVNADDFGMSAAINAAIIDAFDRALISSATIMPNMPAFEEACVLVHRHDLAGKIGLHLNFTSGKPVSAEIAAHPRFCDRNGGWRPQRKVFMLNKQEQSLFEMEIKAQVLACERQGIILTHWDSHHHMHTEPGIAPVVIRMAKRLGVKAIRPGLNYGPGRAGASRAHRLIAQTYRDAFNVLLKFHDLSRVDVFTDAQDAPDLIRIGHANVEVMVHPMPNHRGDLVDSDGHDLEERIASLGIMQSELSSYAAVLCETGLPAVCQTHLR
jgi:predicted glycoside hydrolase/deacetylase ChbG (UPF0249 family)